MNGQNIPLEPGLWLVGVPIGTARDITLRALDVLVSADLLAAEDTRSLRKLMDIHGIPLGGRRLMALHEHSGPKAMNTVLTAIQSGQSVAYASEAGMPLIADPGFELVRAARAAGLRVTCAPGPSAMPTALALGGLPTDAFHFAGFLPSAGSARKRALADLKEIRATLVLYESPKRIGAFLRDAAEILGPDREARLCRELTKKFEEIRAGSLRDLHEGVLQHPPKGEIVVLIDRPAKPSFDEADLARMLSTALETLSLKDASAAIARETGLPRKTLYQLGLDLAR